MKIISVEFATSPSAKKMYDDGCSFNKAWVDEIEVIISATISHPSLGTSEKDLSIPRHYKKLARKKKIKELDGFDNQYKEVGARSAHLSPPDKNPSMSNEDKDHPRLVYAVYEISSYDEFIEHLRVNEEGDVFKRIKDSSISIGSEKEFKLGNYGIVVIIEVGGHYIHKDKGIDPIKASAIEEFDPNNPDHIDRFFDEYFGVDDL
jgi:hypothetical protein